jgi:uncharacterized protein YkvS
MQNRKTITKNRSGGIMVGFKDNLAKHIDIVNTDSKYVMWLLYCFLYKKLTIDYQTYF